MCPLATSQKDVVKLLIKELSLNYINVRLNQVQTCPDIDMMDHKGQDVEVRRLPSKASLMF